ncbi:MAG: alpha/beta hydrolase [Dysgonamonadaceae bacterium]|jgi:acetyl esterase/lipase|nr:alpha/beta hydrolase [Dysgonamonadaceae bacterium]
MRIYFQLLCFFVWQAAFAQQIIPLYPGKIPNFKESADKERIDYDEKLGKVIYAVSRPALTAFFPSQESAVGTAIVICPGGGYVSQLSNREGADVARRFNELGVAAFVLKYRLPDDEAMIGKSFVPLIDVRQAIRLVRQQAEEWNINPHRIGIMGFSAGGHLASTAGTHFDTCQADNPENVDIRPDFMILINPVISLGEKFGHKWSRIALLGDSATQQQIDFFSNELHVDKQTPPSFMVHCDQDSVVLAENSMAFYRQLRKNNIPVEMHIYAKGEHGFISAPPFDEWFGRCVYWMKSMNLF